MPGSYRHTNDGHCRSCGVAVAWFKTPSGSNLLINLKEFREAWPHAAPGITFEAEAAKTQLLPHNHFATCPNADQHRRRKP